MNPHGHVTIAGAGPGDPGLITVAAARALAEADVVVFDALANRALLRGAKPDATLIDAGKRSGDHTLTQAEIETLLIEYARAGKRVLRLKGGDPFVFGRGGEEAQACARAGVSFTVVPGVTSAVAAAAYAGIPVTHRGLARNFLVITGDERGGTEGERWTAAASADTVVILMGAATLEANMASLVAAGKPPSTPAACIQWGTHPGQRVLVGEVGTIAGIAREAGIGSPLVTVVGHVVGLAAEIGWYRAGPLAGRRVVVTRARDQASGLAARFEVLGAEVVEAPVLTTRLLEPNPALANALDGMAHGGWIAVTSAHGVDALFATLKTMGRDARGLAGMRIAAVGAATAAGLEQFGIRADFVPSRATSETLAAELPVGGAPVVIIGSTLSGPEFEGGLRGRGANVIAVVGYETGLVPLDAATLERVLPAEAITFTSSSTVTNFHRSLVGRPLAAGAKLVSIGPKTSTRAKELFGRVDGEAKEPTIEALVAATVEALAWE